MKRIMVCVVILFLAMSAGLVYGFGFGDGWAEVQLLMDYPWFVVSLVDVYVGFALFSFWIIVRERPLVAVAWIVPLMLLGNVIACVYAFLALRRAQITGKSLFSA